MYCDWSVAIQYSNCLLKKEFSLFSAAINKQSSKVTFGNLGIFFQFTMGTGTGDEVDTQEVVEDIREIDASELEQFDS